MSQYFVSEAEHQWLERCGYFPDNAPAGYLRFWNKNASEVFLVKVIRQVENRYGWIVETDAIPPYFLKIFHLERMSDG